MFVRTTNSETYCGGFDEIALIGWGLGMLGGGVWAVVQFSPAETWIRPLLGFLVVFCMGSRYAVRIAPEGIRLTMYQCWFIPVYRWRYWLDADIDIYQDLRDDAPDGLFIRESCDDDPDEDNASTVFGPRFGRARIFRLHARLADALGRIRQAMSCVAVPPELRSSLLASQMGAFDLVRAARDRRGRLRRVRSVAPVYVGYVLVPPGSTFYFNEDRFLDPRREDQLREVVLGSSIPIFGLMARAGASLVFAPSGRLSSLRGAFDAEVEIDGNWVDGREIVAFDENGDLTSFTLAEGARTGGHRIPKGSRFQRWPEDDVLPARWTVRLGGPLELPDVTLGAGESVELSDDGRVITAISPRHDLQVAGLVVRAGIVPIPLREDGRIDAGKCMKSGLFRSREEASEEPESRPSRFRGF